jgi:imidazolonepropionase-like amidohydrolase
MSVPFLLPSRLADPPPAEGTTVLLNARLFDGTGDPVRDNVAVTITDGRIHTIGSANGGPEGSRVIDLEGRFLMPGLIDCHTHLTINTEPDLAEGEEALRPGVVGHIVAANLRHALRMGITTVREVGAHGDTVFEVRQAARHGAFRIPRLLISGRLVSATSPQASHFHDMYREADGPDEMRKAAREQIRSGADFVKIMTTGARSVEWENPGPAQMTREEVAAVVDEAHRLGFRVAAHCEGLEGTRLAIEEGVDTIEHGFYLHQEPALLEQLAARGGVLVPTLTFLHDVAETHADEWSTHLVERGAYNVEEANRTLVAAIEAGVPIAMGFDSAPEWLAATELGFMVEAGMSTSDALRSATAIAAYALGIDDQVGTVERGKLADLIVIDGDPLEDIGVLVDEERVHLVFQSGEPVAGSALSPTLSSHG